MSNWLSRQTRDLVGVIVRPRSTMQRVGGESEFWLPLILVAIAIAGLRLTSLPEVRAQYADPKVIEQYQKQRGVSGADAEAQLKRISQLTPALMVAEAPIMVLAGAAAVALILQLIARLGYKQLVPFRRMFAIVAWGSVISVIPLCLNLIVAVIAPDYSLPTSAAGFLPSRYENGYLYNVLLSLDIFIFWQVWLLSLGFAALCEIGIQRALGAVGTLFVIFIALNSLLLGVGH